MSSSPQVFDVDDASFQTAVLDRSHEVPVVVDFWAAWCGPCRTLGPMLEAAVTARGGEVVLAKVDVDANPGIAQAFKVQGIPQVYGFRAGKAESQFTGVVPEAQLEAFLDALVPSEADRLVALAAGRPTEEAVVTLRAALELDPTHREGALALASLLVDSDPDAARELVAPHRPDPAAEAILSRASLAADGPVDIDALRAEAAGDRADGEVLVRLGRALAARDQYDDALDALLLAVERDDGSRDTARDQLVQLFGVLGAEDPRVAGARAKLARALF